MKAEFLSNFYGKLMQTFKKDQPLQISEEEIQRVVLEERRRMAREIHDNLGPALCYLQTQAIMVLDCIANGDFEQAMGQSQRMSEVAQETQQWIRGYLRELKISSEKDFFSQIEEQLRNFCKLYHFSIDSLTVFRPKMTLFPPNTVIQIIRIIQEACQNIQKHAFAKEISLTIRLHQDAIQVVIADDGKGFSVESEGIEIGYGLSIMRERAGIIGGQLEIESAPGHGTKVILEIPIGPSVMAQNDLMVIILKKRCNGDEGFNR